MVRRFLLVGGGLLGIFAIFAAIYLSVFSPEPSVPITAVLSPATSSTSVATPTESVVEQPPVVPTVETPAPPAPLGVPTSLVVRRGDQVILSAGHIGRYTFTGSKVNPPGNEPVWLDNVGSMVGSNMQTAWIAGHTQEGNSAMPFNQLGVVAPGDLIEITTETGTVSAVVDPDGVVKPTKGRVRVTNDDNVIKLISCTPDGSANVIVTAHLIES